MTRLTVHEYAAALRFARGQALRPRCWVAKKREKGKILDELCQTTGLHHAVRLGNTIYAAAIPLPVTATYEASRGQKGRPRMGTPPLA